LEYQRSTVGQMGGGTISIPYTGELISIKECRNLLNIQSRDTINEYLKALGFFGRDFLRWSEVRQILEMQIFLGLRHGCNSKAMFCELSRKEIEDTFTNYGINIEERLSKIQRVYYRQRPLVE
jgi:hypothetical protein